MLALLRARAAAARAPDDRLSLYVASIPTEIPLLRALHQQPLEALALFRQICEAARALAERRARARAAAAALLVRTRRRARAVCATTPTFDGRGG